MSIDHYHVFYFVNLKLKFNDLKLVGLLRKFICRYPYVLVINAVNLN